MQNDNSPNKKLDLISIGDASEYLGISIDTLRRWEKKGKIQSLRSPGGHRYFNKTELDLLFGRKYERDLETKPRGKKEILISVEESKEDRSELLNQPNQSYKEVEIVSESIIEPSQSIDMETSPPPFPDRQIRAVNIPQTEPIKIIIEKNVISTSESAQSIEQIKVNESIISQESILSPPTINSNINHGPEALKEVKTKDKSLLTAKQKIIIFLISSALLILFFIFYVLYQSSQRILTPIP